MSGAFIKGGGLKIMPRFVQVYRYASKEAYESGKPPVSKGNFKLGDNVQIRDFVAAAKSQLQRAQSRRYHFFDKKSTLAVELGIPPHIAEDVPLLVCYPLD